MIYSKILPRFFIVTLVLLVACRANALVLAEYDFEGNTITPSSAPVANLSVSDFLDGGGYANTTFFEDAGDITRQVSGAGIPGNPVATAVENADAGEKFYFTVTANSEALLNLDTISLTARRGSTSPDKFTLFVTPDGGNRQTIIDGAGVGTSYQVYGSTGNLTANTGLQNISSAVFEFVFHGFNQGNGFDRINAVLLEGSVAVPEPGAYALIAGFIGLICVVVRRRQR